MKETFCFCVCKDLFISFVYFFPQPGSSPRQQNDSGGGSWRRKRPSEEALFLFQRVARCGAQTAAFSQPVGGVCRHGPSLGSAHSACASLQREAIRAAYSPSNSDPLGFTADSSLRVCLSVFVCASVCV